MLNRFLKWRSRSVDSMRSLIVGLLLLLLLQVLLLVLVLMRRVRCRYGILLLLIILRQVIMLNMLWGRLGRLLERFWDSVSITANNPIITGNDVILYASQVRVENISFHRNLLVLLLIHLV